LCYGSEAYFTKKNGFEKGKTRPRQRCRLTKDKGPHKRKNKGPDKRKNKGPDNRKKQSYQQPTRMTILYIYNI
jgi:hypothetical protein